MKFFISALLLNTFFTEAQAYQSIAERKAACGANPYPYAYACPSSNPICNPNNPLLTAIQNYRNCISLAEQTNFAEGEVPTYTLPNGKSFTLYYSNGTPVPAGTNIVMTPTGAKYVTNSEGNNTGIYLFSDKTEALAAGAAAKASANQPPEPNGVSVGGGLPGTPLVQSTFIAPPTVADDPARIKIIADAALAIETAAPVCTNSVNYSAGTEPEEVASALLIGDQVMRRIMLRNSCAGAGNALPLSVSKWFEGIQEYAKSENERNTNYTRRVNYIKNQISTDKKVITNTSSLQNAAIQLQSELFIFTIESLNQRVALREALIAKGEESFKANTKENDDIVKVYQQTLIANGLDKAMDAAKKACAQTSTVTTCSDANDPSTCKSEIAVTPIEGCKEAQDAITKIRTGKVQAYGENYLAMSGPSKALNDKCKQYEDDIENLINKVPRAPNSNNDWTTPMKNGINAMSTTRKAAGRICKSDSTALNIVSQYSATEAYKQFDQVIGLPFKRADYLKTILDSLKSSLCNDRAAILEAQKNLTNLIKYNKEIDIGL
jgi:hypothetical protein